MSAAYREGVGIMLVNHRGEVFVGRRADTADAWQMPQGGIDAGESPAAAARRELFEETGVRDAEIIAETRGWLHYDLPPEIAARVWGGRYRGQRQKWFLMRLRDGDVDLARAPHHEFVDGRWVRPPEVLRLIVPFKRALYERVLAEFAPYLDALGGSRA